jgi:hypothetical protein
VGRSARRIVRPLAFLLALLAFAPAAQAQVPLKGELARLGFMLGEWQGTGWVRYEPDGPMREARVTGQGEARLSGVALGWASVATSSDREQAVVLSNDLSVRFRADSSVYRATLRHGSASVQGWVRAEACTMEWGYTDPADARSLFRFSSRLAGGSCVEAGERSSDGGSTWWPFYAAEMSGPAVEGCEASAQTSAEPAA